VTYLEKQRTKIKFCEVSKTIFHYRPKVNVERLFSVIGPYLLL